MAVAIRRKYAKDIDWGAVQKDFLTENIRRAGNEAPYTLRDVASKWALSYGAVRNRASQDGWNDTLAEKITERNQKAVARVVDVEVINEFEVRTRQARFARLALNKAILRIQEIQPSELTAREAIDLLRVGLQEERRALGMPDVFTFSPPPENEQGGYSSVIDHVNRQRQLQSLGSKLLEFVERRQREH